MLNTENALLIIIDIQGKLAKVVHESEKHNTAACKMIAGALALDLPVLLTAQAPEKIGHTTDEVRALLPDLAEYPRTGFSVASNQALLDAIEETGRKQIILCGFETHICIYQSTLDLIATGYEVYILSDAVSSRDLQNKTYTLLELRHEGAHLLNVETALFALIRDTSHPAFRAIAKIIK